MYNKGNIIFGLPSTERSNASKWRAADQQLEYYSRRNEGGDYNLVYLCAASCADTRILERYPGGMWYDNNQTVL